MADPSVPSPVDPAEAERLAEAVRLAEAEQYLRGVIKNGNLLAGGRQQLPVLLAEYERRGAVEKAAAALLRAAGGPEDEYREKLAALVTAVRTNGEFRG